MAKKYLYCPECKEYPDGIVEVYPETVKETRFWDEKLGEYGIEGSNMEDMAYYQICGKCGALLEEKNQNEGYASQKDYEESEGVDMGD